MRPFVHLVRLFLAGVSLAAGLACAGALDPAPGEAPPPQSAPGSFRAAAVASFDPADTTIDLSHPLAGGRITSSGHASFTEVLGRRPLDPWVEVRSARVNYADTPVRIDVGFLEGRAARVDRVVLEPGGASIESYPRTVEIWASNHLDGEDFVPVARAELPAAAGPHLIRLPDPIQATRLRIVMVDAHNAPRVSVMALRVLEAPGPSVLADHTRQLQHPLAGGTLVRTEGPLGPGALGFLPLGVASTSSWEGPVEGLPLDFVYAFRGDGTARVDRVVVYPGGTTDPPGTVSVHLSTVSPTWGFTEAARGAASPGEPLTLPLAGREARFVLVRYHDAPGRRLYLRGVEIFESAGPSLLEAPLPRVADLAAPPAAPLDVDGPAWSAGASLPLGAWAIGGHQPGSQQVWGLDVPGSGPSVALNLELRGTPSIGVGLTLRDARAEVVSTRQPPKPGEQANTWVVPPGRYTLEASRSADVVAFLWDESGSMRTLAPSVRGAIGAWVASKAPAERVRLMPFDDAPIDRLKGFVDDPTALDAALAIEGTFRGGTAMYTALDVALTEIEEQPGNRAIVLVTDGVSTPPDKEKVWRKLEASGVPIHVIGLGEGMAEWQGGPATSPARQLCHLARANGGLCLVAPQAADIPTAYATIRERLRASGQYAIRATVEEARGSLTVAAEGERLAASARDVVLILDASCSMKKVAGEADRMAVAKEALRAIVQELPPDTRVGLRLYGHRILEGRPGACEDTELAVPMGPLDKDALIERIEAVQPLGTTPIAYALSQVAADLRGAEGAPLVILMTDGDEECRGDPAKAAQDLRSAGLDVRVEVVGMDLGAAAANRMRAVAEQGGGTYHEGRDAQVLAKAIRTSLAVPFVVTDAGRREVASGRTGGDPLDLPVGTYTLRLTTPDGPLVVPNVGIGPDAPTRVRVARIGGRTTVEVGR